MANASEKSDDCPIVGPINKQLHEMMAHYSAELIVNKAETTLDDAVAHTGAHMLQWIIEALFEYHRRDPVQVAGSLMGMLEHVAQKAGVPMRGNVVAVAAEAGKGPKETTH